MNTITFGGVTSSTYDIYISGEGVWDAPEREAELISIPGRNGDFIQDKGKFQNITVTYPAFIVKDNNTNFKTQIDAFRNAMSAKVGYQNLTDSFHTNEYRMAAFIGGMEIEPLLYNDHAATFDLVFECMPQRFLISGENPVSMTSGDTITNPTLFDAKPMVEVEGYGEIDLNGFNINIDNTVLGNIVLQENITNDFTASYYEYSIPLDLCNVGDAFTVESVSLAWGLIVNGTITSVTGAFKIPTQENLIVISKTIPNFNGVVGTNKTTSDSFNVQVIYDKNGTSHTTNWNWSYTYKLQSDVFTLTIYNYLPPADTNITLYSQVDHILKIGVIKLDSTLSILGHPLYIDCDLGDAYKYENDQYVSLNSRVDLGSDLPVLNSGANTITYDNTITSLKVVPRWWQI